MNDISRKQLYSEVLGAPLNNFRTDWGSVNPTSGTVFLSIWADQLEDDESPKRVSVLELKPIKRKPGYSQRKKHLHLIRNGSPAYGVMCRAKEPIDPESRQLASVDSTKVYKLGKIIETSIRLYMEVLEEISFDRLEIDANSWNSVTQDIEEITNSSRPQTSKKALIDARLGQGKFREKVLEAWDRKCCVTNTSVSFAIRASHIQSWKDSTDVERLDPNNGLPLAATLDALFDTALITFNEGGELVVSERISEEEKKLLNLSGPLSLSKNPCKNAKYLEVHRRRFESKQKL